MVSMQLFRKCNNTLKAFWSIVLLYKGGSNFEGYYAFFSGQHGWITFSFVEQKERYTDGYAIVSGGVGAHPNNSGFHRCGGHIYPLDGLWACHGDWGELFSIAFSSIDYCWCSGKHVCDCANWHLA
jgi:hypothetical protein